MKITPTYTLEDAFNLVVREFGNKIRQQHCGSEFISCGDDGEVTVSFRKNTTSATLCIYDNTLMAVCNSSVNPIYRPTQKANGDFSGEELLGHPSHLSNKIIMFILRNIPSK